MEAIHERPAIHERLLAWFDAHKRDLPWRGVGDPYAVWISEVMLQQTRAGTVVPYYRRWMKRFPDVGALADADLEEVLRLWRGLGYYARARNAHRCARRVRDDLGGVFPAVAEGLRALPGIGPYTAAAVASIAFGEVAPAVDGNVRRVVARLFDLADPSLARARGLAGGLMDTAHPGDFNEAMMELGATVCTPRSPSCGTCPLATDCRALAAGTVAERPLGRRRPRVPTRTLDVLVAVSPGGKTLVVRRPTEGLLGGMWEFPAVDREDGADPDAGRSRFAEPTAGAAANLPSVTHRFSHFTAVYRPRRVEVAVERRREAGRWVTPTELAELPLPVAQQRIARRAGLWGSSGRDDDGVG